MDIVTDSLWVEPDPSPSMEIDTRHWDLVGATSNCRFFSVAESILAVIPHVGSVDDLQASRENLQFQYDYFARQGRSGVILVFVDLLVSQDKEARRVYKAVDPRFVRATGLIAETLLGRAIASWFLGVSKPDIPIKIFDDSEAAIAWARTIVVIPADPDAPTRAENRS